MKSQKYGVIATQKDKYPYTNLVAYAPSSGLKSIFFATKQDSTKYFNLINNPCVSMLIDNRKNQSSDIKKASIVSAEGNAKNIIKNKKKVKKYLLEKHPELAGFLNEPDCELFELEINNYLFVDDFDNKKTLSMKR